MLIRFSALELKLNGLFWAYSAHVYEDIFAKGRLSYFCKFLFNLTFYLLFITFCERTGLSSSGDLTIMQRVNPSIEFVRKWRHAHFFTPLPLLSFNVRRIAYVLSLQNPIPLQCKGVTSYMVGPWKLSHTTYSYVQHIFTSSLSYSQMYKLKIINHLH